MSKPAQPAREDFRSCAVYLAVVGIRYRMFDARVILLRQANELVSKVVSVSVLRDDVGEIASLLRDQNDNPILGAPVACRCEFLGTGHA